MVRSPKKITRRELRRPDAFITFTSRLFHFYQQQKTVIFTGAGLFVVVFLGFWSWNLYQARQHRLAGREYTHALVLYQSGKYQEAIDALAKVATHRFSLYSHLALLYQANSHLALKETAKAITVLGEFLRREHRDPLLRQLGLLTLGYAQEKAGQCKDAAMSFAGALKIEGPFKEEALLSKARCAMQDRDFKEALNVYREYLSSYPGSERINEISLRVKELEAMTKEVSGG